MQEVERWFHQLPSALASYDKALGVPGCDGGIVAAWDDQVTKRQGVRLPPVRGFACSQSV